MKIINYEYLLDIDKLNDVFYTIKKNSKHREKILKFSIFYTSNIFNDVQLLKIKMDDHSKYN